MPPSSLSGRKSLLRTGLLRLRPAFVASAVKKALGVRRQVVRTPHGSFFIDPVSNLGDSLLGTGEYEPEMRRTLENFLAPGSVFVDVGANEGYFSVIGRKLVGDAGVVVAVEPQARLQPVLAENFRLNGATGIRLARCALSDSSGKASLHISPDTNTGSSSLDQSTAYALPTQETDVLRMAELFAREGLERADLVKMDIEGFEYEAIFGSRELFTGRRIRAFALELHPSRIQRRGLDPAAIASFLSGAGYAPHKDFASVWIAPES